LEEVDTPAFWKFVDAAIAGFGKFADRVRQNPEDIMPWKVLGQKWHFARKGFPPGKTVEFASSNGKVVFDGKVHADKGLKCADCHTKPKLFEMKKGGDKITMAAMNNGKFCGACHDGTKAFSVKVAADCAKCHDKTAGAGKPAAEKSTAAASKKESVGEYVDDAVITTKVKAAIMEEPSLKSAEINVETHKGTVQLSGFVGSRADINKAVVVAKGVKGVKSVKNDMIVKGQQ
jgi:c(7)-type cytochrome triheme protein